MPKAYIFRAVERGITHRWCRVQSWLRGAESCGGASFGSGDDVVAVPCRRRRFERMKEAGRHSCDLVDSGFKRRLIGFRGLVETTDFAYELKRCCTNFRVRGGRFEVEKQFYAPAHDR